MGARLLAAVAGWRGPALLFVAGALASLAFAPFGIWPLAPLALALLFLCWVDAAPRRAAWCGFAFGAGLFGFGIYWIFISVHFHGYVPLPLALLITAALMAFMAAYFALVGYLVARLCPPRLEARVARLRLLLLMPAAWVVGEWLRGWLFTGFPWLSLGYSQIDTPLAALAPLGGVFAVSALVALSAALLVALLLERRHRLHYGLGLALVWGGAALLDRIEWGEPAGKPIEATLLQGNVPQEMKWLPSMRRPTITLYTELTRQHWRSDLIVWPESALPAFYYEVEPFLDDLAEEARANDTDLLIGLLHRDDDGRYYNSMVALGEARAFYHKRHLVPFTEYLPLKELLGSLVRVIQVPMSDFSAGPEGQPPPRLAGWPVGISICFEDAFGEEVIGALPQAALLVNVSNDAWFNDSTAPHQHLEIARMRARETGRYLLRATNTGISAIIDERGRVVARSPQFQIDALTAEVVPRRGLTPYAATGNAPLVVVALAVAAFAVWRCRRRPSA